MLLVARREGNRDDGIVLRREASAAAAHSWACGRAKGRGDGKRLGHRWLGMSGMAAYWRHDAGRRVSRPPGSVQLRRCRAYTPGTHARKEEDELLLEFPYNPTRTRSV
jgi:hypothetical protein